MAVAGFRLVFLRRRFFPTFLRRHYVSKFPAGT